MSLSDPGRPSASLILDIGKTNCKLSLIDPAGGLLAEVRTPNAVRHDGPYPHHDVERLWDWMLGQMREFAALAEVKAIVPVTHGATAALVDERGLVLPVLDYEHGFVDEAYAAVRPAFDQTQSPELSAGLNLGRQLHWLANRHPAEFARAQAILMYPQYWAWRLCGVLAGEVTSLGCHTDLWNPASQDYSSLVESMGWQTQLPPLRMAWERLGVLTPEVRALTGLPEGCEVVCGIHDSNASLLRHILARQADGGEPCTVLSTGTWVIAAALGSATRPLVESQDMLANCNVLGEAVPCMRFMGGREFAALAGSPPAEFDLGDIERLIALGTHALPCFAETGGPFAGRVGSIEGPKPKTAAERSALATLYAVLMTDWCLDALGVEQGAIVVEGAFTANPWFGPLLAGLKPDRRVVVSDDASGTTAGGWLLQQWGAKADGEQLQQPVAPLALPGLAAYAQGWRRRLPS
ncbi:FGGY family carbohydrate kinase [Pelomonas sp. SE-A7]|uniref:FGGY-family carbohydrate kinase n=1 Tax=Pelomonas sp. SE-A7 TaxID=3054953 RepID=UPI00259C6890|nr:FGGY family carbohydrate kinase [Pelomonas sp. SE-A7]MDM4765246.1 FGGY family carbohydrate kinase [Pelomonas sp. SE-A7]